LDETGIILGLTRLILVLRLEQELPTSNHFIEGQKVTAIGAISMNKVLALMTMNDSMDGRAFAVFIEKVFMS
jgi:hypothetical protein